MSWTIRGATRLVACAQLILFVRYTGAMLHLVPGQEEDIFFGETYPGRLRFGKSRFETVEQGNYDCHSTHGVHHMVGRPSKRFL
jgi:hypothetical protein